MSHQPSSAVTKLKRDLALLAVAFIGVGVLMHVAVPSFDFIQTIGIILGWIGDYPKVAIVLIGLFLIFATMAVVDDHFRS